MTARKQHIPLMGGGVGLHSTALCGRWAKYGTGDHVAIRNAAIGAIRRGEGTSHYCARCLARLRAAMKVQP